MGGPLTAIAVGAMVGGTVMQAQAQKQAGKEEKKIREANAANILAESERETRAKGEEARERRLAGKRLEGQQITGFAKTGVKAGVGTSLLVRNESLRRIEAQARVIQEHGTFARQLGQSQAALQIAQGKAAKRRGKLQAGTTLATGFGTAFLLGGPYGGGGSSSSGINYFARRGG